MDFKSLNRKIEDKTRLGLPILFSKLKKEPLGSKRLLINIVEVKSLQTRSLEVNICHKPISKFIDISTKNYE